MTLEKKAKLIRTISTIILFVSIALNVSFTGGILLILITIALFIPIGYYSIKKWEKKQDERSIQIEMTSGYGAFFVAMSAVFVWDIFERIKTSRQSPVVYLMVFAGCFAYLLFLLFQKKSKK